MKRKTGICDGCGVKTGFFALYRCPNCKSALCPACAKKNGGGCDKCFTPLDLLS